MKSLRFQLLSCIILIVNFLILSCQHNTKSIYLSDRHRLAYEDIASYAKEHGPVELLLIDYHHDMGVPSSDGQITSWNGASELIQRGYIKKIYWVSGYELLLPQKNARKAWLARKLKDYPPSIQDKLSSYITLYNWAELPDLHRAKNLVITIDLDVFTKNPGPSISSWISSISKNVASLNYKRCYISFSAVYEPDPEKTWQWLGQFVNELKIDHNFVLMGEVTQSQVESEEEQLTLTTWSRAQKALYTGQALWDNSPYIFTSIFYNAPNKISAHDRWAQASIDIWRRDPLAGERLRLQQSYPSELLAEYATSARQALGQQLANSNLRSDTIPPDNPRSDLGMAVRFINARTQRDRGCFAYYRGLLDGKSFIAPATSLAAFYDPRYSPINANEFDDITVEISIFGRFVPMRNFEDFIPGQDSLFIDDGVKTTLLQAGLVPERNLTKRAFVNILLNKAHLSIPPEDPRIKWYRAPTVFYLQTSDTAK